MTTKFWALRAVDNMEWLYPWAESCELETSIDLKYESIFRSRDCAYRHADNIYMNHQRKMEVVEFELTEVPHE